MIRSNQSVFQPIETPVDVFTRHGAMQNGFLECVDKYSIWYFGILTVVLYVVTVLISPYSFPEDSENIFYLATFVVFNIFANFTYSRMYKPFYKPMLPANELPHNTWRFCSYCQHMQPPLCHHCPLCHQCISRRDHHCFFIGLCVGEKNQGYFIIYCLHCAIGLLMGSTVLASYLSSNYYEVLSLDFYKFLPPVVLINLVIGYVDFLTFLTVVLMFVSGATGIFALGLFVWEFVLVSTNLTSYQLSLWWKGDKIYWSKIRFCYNLRKTFGSYWMINFFLPLPNRGASSNPVDPVKHIS